MRGSGFLIPARGGPITLSAGDVVLLPLELGHAIADMLTTPLVAARTAPDGASVPVGRHGRPCRRAIAARTGYVSEFAFAKAFKREFGVAPGRYREQPAAPPPDAPRVVGLRGQWQPHPGRIYGSTPIS